eukprot:1175778-Prorocentrum_minimum.AAC.7
MSSRVMPNQCQGSTRTNQTQEAWVYSHDGPIRHRKPYCGTRHGPIRRRKRGYILMTDHNQTQKTLQRGSTRTP